MKAPFLVCLLMNAIAVYSQPLITSFSPASGPAGTSVTITGNNFDPTPVNNIVFFGAAKGTVTAATATSLTVTVPTSASYQKISVLNTTTGLIGFSQQPFILTFNTNSQTMSAAMFGTQVSISLGSFSSGTGSHIQGIDMDDDARPDILLDPYNSTSIYKNQYNGGSVNPAAFNTKTAINSYSFARCDDIDGDGKADVISYGANGGIGYVYVSRNDIISGAYNFGTAVAFSTGMTSVSGVTLADIDADGKSDIIAWSGTNAAIFRNVSTAGNITASSFAAPVAITMPRTINQLLLSDLDNDNKPDLLAAMSGSTNISVYRNNSSPGSITSASFGSEINFTGTYNAPTKLAAGDLDGDGYSEILVGYSATPPYFSVFKNQTTTGVLNSSSFAAKVDFAGTPALKVFIAEVTGDGKPDILCAWHHLQYHGKQYFRGGDQQQLIHKNGID